MAGDDDAEAVPSTKRARRALSTRVACEPRKIAGISLRGHHAIELLLHRER